MSAVVPPHLVRSWAHQRELSLLAYKDCGPIARRLCNEGLSLRLIANALNKLGYRLRRNESLWTWASVRHLLTMFP